MPALLALDELVVYFVNLFAIFETQSSAPAGERVLLLSRVVHPFNMDSTNDNTELLVVELRAEAFEEGGVDDILADSLLTCKIRTIYYDVPDQNKIHDNSGMTNREDVLLVHAPDACIYANHALFMSELSATVKELRRKSIGFMLARESARHPIRGPVDPFLYGPRRRVQLLVKERMEVGGCSAVQQS